MRVLNSGLMPIQVNQHFPYASPNGHR